jgi:hypothetical protein
MLDSTEERSYRYYHTGEPHLDRSVSFGFSEQNVDALVMKDSDGVWRLVQVRRGKGKATVTGNCWFMTTSYLREPPNARLAWNLLAEDSGAGEPGVLFIRGRREEARPGFLGRLFERGNFFALILSALVLSGVGFWAALPVFGLVKGDEVKRGKPLRERFLAEGQFLKKFGALETYLAAYQDEIKRKLMKKEGLKDDHEIILRAVAIWKEAGGQENSDAVEQAFFRSPVKHRNFRKTILILKTILERL